MLVQRIGRTIRLVGICFSAPLLAACAPQMEVEHSGLFGWLAETFEVDEEGTMGKPISCRTGKECQTKVVKINIEGCEHVGNLTLRGPKNLAYQLGRLANCYERSGQTQMASSYRIKQREMHTKYGSVLYPASYYQAKRDERSLQRVSAQHTGETCINGLEDLQHRSCKDCAGLLVYRNTCRIPVHLAYCNRKGSLATTARECHEHSTIEPGERFVVLGWGEEIVEKFKSFRSNSERREWIQRQTGSL